MKSVADLAKAVNQLPAPVRRIFDVRVETGACRAPATLAKKYNVAQENSQTIVVVTNRALKTTTYINRARTQKPQTFLAARAELEDPTIGKGCDFCSWPELTAADEFGRVENEHAVTASNLFKISGFHGVLLFKHHDPLAFSEAQLLSLLACGDEWFQRAHKADPLARHPLLLWNCAPRAGASQFHGHAQVMLNYAPLPGEATLAESALAHAAASSGSGGAALLEDMTEAHRALGLAHEIRVGDASATVFPTIAPWKDCETQIVGRSVTCPAFGRGLYASMRALIDRLGVTSFNVAIWGIRLRGGNQAEKGADLAPAGHSEASSGVPWGSLADVFGGERVFCRIVSRGNAASKASDFGTLEVLGGASIGHTDPWVVSAAIGEEIAGLR